MGVTISRVVMMVVFTLITCSAIAQETVSVEVFYRSSMHSEPQSRVPGADITLWNLDKPKLIKRQKPSITGTEREVREKSATGSPVPRVKLTWPPLVNPIEALAKPCDIESRRCRRLSWTGGRSSMARRMSVKR